MIHNLPATSTLDTSVPSWMVWTAAVVTVAWLALGITTSTTELKNTAFIGISALLAIAWVACTHAWLDGKKERRRQAHAAADLETLKNDMRKSDDEAFHNIVANLRADR